MACNLLLVTFDQWRGDWGNPWKPVIPLPGLERLARQGWTAERCYTSSPQCVPARLSWLTGLAPSQLGVTRNQPVWLPPDAPSLVRELQEHGWWTELVGKSHWTPHNEPRDLRADAARLHGLGFDRVLEIAGPRALRRIDCALTDAWREAGVLESQRAALDALYRQGQEPSAWQVQPTTLPNALYPDIWLTDQALDRLECLPEHEPWLLWVSLVGPHEPFDTPSPWNGRNHWSRLPAATQQPAWIQDLPEQAELRQLIERWGERLTVDDVRACRADYADRLQLLDTQLQRLLRAVECRKDAARTAIAVTADHGELLGDAGCLYKGALLEGAVHVPWIYRPPGGSEPRRYRHPLPLTELLSKVMKQLKAGSGADGLQQWAQRQPGAVVEFGAERLLVSGKRKLVVDAEGHPLWAVDLRRDPEEQHNLLQDGRKPWHQSLGWWNLRRWAQRIHHERSRPDWCWRHLAADS